MADCVSHSRVDDWFEVNSPTTSQIVIAYDEVFFAIEPAKKRVDLLGVAAERKIAAMPYGVAWFGRVHSRLRIKSFIHCVGVRESALGEFYNSSTVKNLGSPGFWGFQVDWKYSFLPNWFSCKLIGAARRDSLPQTTQFGDSPCGRKSARTAGKGTFSGRGLPCRSSQRRRYWSASS